GGGANFPAAFSSVAIRFFFSSRRRHTRFSRDWSSDVCSSDLIIQVAGGQSLHDRLDGDVVLFEAQGIELDANFPLRAAFDGDRRSEERRVGKEGRPRGAGEEEIEGDQGGREGDADVRRRAGDA